MLRETGGRKVFWTLPPCSLCKLWCTGPLSTRNGSLQKGWAAEHKHPKPHPPQVASTPPKLRHSQPLRLGLLTAVPANGGNPHHFLEITKTQGGRPLQSSESRTPYVQIAVWEWEAAAAGATGGLPVLGPGPGGAAGAPGLRPRRRRGLALAGSCALHGSGAVCPRKRLAGKPAESNSRSGTSLISSICCVYLVLRTHHWPFWSRLKGRPAEHSETNRCWGVP